MQFGINRNKPQNKSDFNGLSNIKNQHDLRLNQLKDNKSINNRSLYLKGPATRYHDPIDKTPGRIQGNSRRWGDATIETKTEVIREIIRSAKDLNYSLEETAFALLVARLESGFNPDAAALGSTAAGVGQLVERTGIGVGLSPEDAFDYQQNTKAMLLYIKDRMEFVKKRYPDISTEEQFKYTYAHYHDGNILQYGGLEISAKQIMPNFNRLISMLKAKISE